MTWLDAVILAIIEGITEYLPVSSTAHIALSAQLLNVPQSSFLNTFNIVIQLAPIVAVMLIFREKLIASLELWKRLIVAFIPVGVVGFLLHDFIDALFDPYLMPFFMMATGIGFILVERMYKEQAHHIEDIAQASYKQSLIVGMFQVFSLIPGVSRSGATILGAMLTGFKREVAMTFSFLLAIPTMGAASGYTLLKEYAFLDFSQMELLGLGFIVSFVVGWIFVKLLLAFIARFSFIPFGAYMIATGLFFWSLA